MTRFRKVGRKFREKKATVHSSRRRQSHPNTNQLMWCSSRQSQEAIVGSEAEQRQRAV